MTKSTRERNILIEGAQSFTYHFNSDNKSFCQDSLRSLWSTRVAQSLHDLASILPISKFVRTKFLHKLCVAPEL